MRSSALRSLLRAGRTLPPPVRRKLASNVRDLVGLGAGDARDAAAAGRLLRWVAGLPQVCVFLFVCVSFSFA
jgi:hypothetical protein